MRWPSSTSSPDGPAAPGIWAYGRGAGSPTRSAITDWKWAHRVKSSWSQSSAHSMIPSDERASANGTEFTDDAALPLLSGTAEACRAAGAITDTEAVAWLAEQRERARTGRLLVTIPIFIAA